MAIGIQTNSLTGIFLNSGLFATTFFKLNSAKILFDFELLRLFSCSAVTFAAYRSEVGRSRVKKIK